MQLVCKLDYSKLCLACQAGIFSNEREKDSYRNCGQLFRLPDGLPIAPELLTKWYRQWRSAHPEFEQIVFHGLRHSSATYQLLQSDGDFKSVQENTGHATAAVLMDTYAHTQNKLRLELAEKPPIRANVQTVCRKCAAAFLHKERTSNLSI